MSYLMLSLAALFWGANYIIGAVLVENVAPIVLTEIRWLLTALLLIAIYYHTLATHWRSIKASWKIIVFLSFCGQALYPFALYTSLEYTSPFNSSLYIASTPAMVLIINRFIFNDKITSNNIMGVFLSSIGVLYLLVKGNATQLDSLKDLNQGDLWALISAISWAFYAACLPKKPANLNGAAFTVATSVIAAFILLPFFALYLSIEPEIKFQSCQFIKFWIGIIYLVIFPSWLAYLFWNKGIVAIGASRGQIFTHLIPLSGALLSLIVFQHRLGAYHWISAVFIVAGIYMCSRPQSLSNVL